MSIRKSGPRFEAALNLLREQQRAVAAVRRQILADNDLRREDPGHRQDLLTQTLREIGQLSEAVTVLERVQAGLSPYAVARVGPRVVGADLPPAERVSGLTARPALPVIGRLA